MTPGQTQGTQRHWDEVVSAALVGVNARTVTAENVDAALADYLDATTDSGSIVLQTAALMSTAVRATVEVVGGAVLIDGAPVEHRPPMSPTAGELALRGLQAGDPELALCVAQMLADSSRAPAPELLPVLLTKARAGGLLAHLIADIVGDTGRWLAAQLPELGLTLPAVGASPDIDTTVLADATRWSLGALPDRVAYLHALRSTDPARGVELLAAGWSGEAGPDREALIGALAIGTARDDEAFLESALDDRRKNVRRAAAELLARRPDSALVARVADVLFGLLTVIGTGPLTIAVDRTAQLSESIVRKGISFASPRGTARFDHVFRQLVAVVPLPDWESRFEATPQEILAALHHDDDYVPLFIDAVERQRDQRWARALSTFIPPTATIASLLPDAVLFDAARAELRPENTDGALVALTSLPRPWSHELAADVVDAVGRRLSARTSAANDQRLAQLLTLMRVGLPIDDATADEPGRWFAEVTALRAWATGLWVNRLATTAEVLQLRTALTRELS